MDRLPKGWKLIVFGDYYDITSSKRVFESDWTNIGVPFYRAREIVKLSQNGFVDNDLFISEEMYNLYSSKYGIPQEDDLMITGVGTLGICYVVKKEDRFYFKDGNIIWFKKKSNEISSRFIEYAFKSDYLKKQINNNTGATVGTYTIVRAKNTNLPLPPLPEQIRIVNKLDSLFERIDKSIALLEENIKHTETLMASVLDELFREIEESLLKPILDVCSIYNKTINPKDGEIYNYVGLENIESVSGRLVDFSPSTGESIKSSKVIFGKNAVLYGKLRPYLNKVWVSDFEGVSTTEILPFKPNNKILDSNYLAYYLRSPKFVNLVNSNTSGARMPRATTGFFKTIAKVPVPELKVQECIVLKLDVLSKKSNKLITEQQSKLSYLKALKASLLDKAFKGEL